MFYVISVLVIIACFLLILVVLIQNPKGGGLSASFGGTGTQFLGARKTTDFLEKATWTLAIALLVLSIVGSIAIDRGDKNLNKNMLQNISMPEQGNYNIPELPVQGGEEPGLE
ncbi:MAG: preprotein translocase subunit SecG [Marinilabiliales bacterium]